LADEPEPLFPVRMDAAQTESARKSVAYLMGLSEREMTALVPAQSGIYFTDCPNCEVGRQDVGRFGWSPQEPGRLTCQGCGESYPGNPKYPDEHVLEVPAPQGVHRFHYYERGDGKRFFFRAHADWWAKEWLERQARDLAEIYAATGDEDCARRAAEILVRFAEVYPGYAVTAQYPFTPTRFAPWTANSIPGVFPYRSSKWSWWAIMDISIPITAAYDAIRDWAGLADMAGGQAARMIEEGLIGGMVRFNLGVPDWERSVHQPRVHKLLAALVLRRPDWVHEALRRYSRVGRSFLYDGCYENTSPSYMQQFLGTLSVWNDAAAGYSDPPGYLDAVDQRRFDNLNLAEAFPFYDRLRAILLATRLPDGRLLPVNDTWSSSRYGGPRDRVEPVMLPGMGVAVLGGGSSEHPMQAWLNFTDGALHKQRDTLSIGLFAHGHELLPDIGYTHTRYRGVWGGATMSHNTVVVDGLPMAGGHPEHLGSRLREYVAATPGLQLVSAENLHAYHGLTTAFRRTLVMVGRDSRDAYLIDVFHVAGGRQHDYLLHGSADADSTATLDGLTMEPFGGTLLREGVAFVEPEGENIPDTGTGYGLIRDLRRAAAVETACLDIRLDTQPGVGTRTLLAAPGARLELYLGRSPSIRRAEESDARLNEALRPTMVARRLAATAPLESVFAAVHEPVQGTPRLHSLTATRQGDGLLLTVRHADGAVDYAAMALTESQAPLRFETPDGPLTLDGAWGLARVRGGAVAEAHLVGGEELALGAFRLRGARGWSGEVRGVARTRVGDSGGWFDVDQSPDGLHGTLIITFADDTIRAFNVTGVEAIAGGARLHVAENPGIEVEGGQVRLPHQPPRTITGARLRWRLAGVAHHPAATAAP